ncbi:MAG: hypothetical protein ILP02_04345, partial [Clostridia bacterium]|nr:hypothetical protein [Clostridia bacterium]
IRSVKADVTPINADFAAEVGADGETAISALNLKIEEAEKAIAVITSAVDAVDEKSRPTVVKDGFSATRKEFFGIADASKRLETLARHAIQLNEERTRVKGMIAAAEAEVRAFKPYLSLKEKFDFYRNTKKTIVTVGLVGNDKINSFIEKCADNGIIAEVSGSDKGQSTIVAVCGNDKRSTLDGILAASGFIRCPFSGDTDAKAETERLLSKIAALCGEDASIAAGLVDMACEVRLLKLYSDHLNFLKQKALADGMLGKTQSTFMLEAYVPTVKTADVEGAVRSATDAVYIAFEVVPRDSFAPTLNKNGRISENFEVVTNMYSAPSYGALDPNAVMSFFFSLFMGVIMADVGYGLLMIVGGFIFARTRRKGTSVYRMAKVFAYGGFFAVVFGAVFDSWLGFALLRGLLGEGYNAFYAAHIDQISATADIMGVTVPSILMWCLALGTAQMGVGLILKAVQSFTRGRVLEGVFGGIVWAIALFSLIVWVYALATGLTPLDVWSSYVLIGATGVGVLTAGIGERGFSIFTKTFSSAFGLINYVSDILSYARLYGLMLSGAQIASIFTNTLAIGMLFPLGVGGIIAGVVLIVVGNVFNLAINLLGAYIHDARLQYVEFYGKFYEGEGQLFTPFGNTLKHAYLED